MKMTRLMALGLASGLAISAPASFAGDGRDDMDAQFALMDADSDGKISDDEHEDFAEKHFKMMDKNSDGSLTKEEIKTAKKAMHGKG